jgi:hypothetical protein
MDLPSKSEDYIFLDTFSEYSEIDTIPIRIVVGPYSGVEFRFDRVSLTQKNDHLNVNFDAEILKSPEGKEISLNDQEFVDFLGNILYDIMVNRTDITAQVEESREPTDLEDDVHIEPHGKDNS